MLTTHGHAAIGILAQSIGGGGGLAGDSGFGLLSEIGDVLACSYVEGASGVGSAVTQQCNAWVGSAGGDAKIGTPYVSGASVTLEITEPVVMGDKLYIYKFRPKNTYQRKTGHRQRYTAVKVSGIKG